MASKLTIRRVGVLLPTLSLVVLLVILLLFTWLGIVGIPAFALRELEEYASEQGIHLKVKKVTLDYTQGLGLRLKELSVYATEAQDGEALIYLPEAEISLELRALLEGTIDPQYVRLHDAVVSIPLEENEEEYFQIRSINVTAHQPATDVMRLSEASVDLDGISVKLIGLINLNELGISVAQQSRPARTPSPKPFNLENELRKLSPYALETKRWIESQQWQADSYPHIELDFQIGSRSQCSIHAVAPRIGHKNYRFKHAVLDLFLDDETIKLNKFVARSNAPQGKISLQGEYRFTQHALSFLIETDLPAIYFASELLDSQDVALLSGLPTLERASNIFKLKGNIHLSEENSVNALFLSGHIEQEHISLSSTRIDKLTLSFFYDNSSFTVDQFKVELPRGEISAQAYLKSGYGKTKLKMDLPSEDLISLLKGFPALGVNEESLNAIKLKGNLRLDLDADISTPDFVPGKSPLIDFMPDLRDTELTISIPQFSYTSDSYLIEAMNPRMELKLKGLNGVRGERPDLIKNAQISLSADQLRQSKGEQELRIETLLSEIVTEELNWKKDTSLDELFIEKSSLFCYAKQFDTTDVKASEININLRDAMKIRPLAPDMKYAQSGSLDFTTSKLSVHGRQAESIDITLQLPDANKLTGDIAIIWNESKKEQLSLSLLWEDWKKLEIYDASCQLSAELASRELPEGFSEEYGLSLLGDISLHDSTLRFDTTDWNYQLLSGNIGLDINKLQRRPVDVLALREKSETVNLSTQLRFERDMEGNYAYDVSELTLQHHSGALEMQVQGNTAGYLQVQGSNNIRLQHLNVLIGSYDAHTIIRDFKLDSKSLFTLTNIEALINYERGLVIEASVDAHLKNLGFAIGAIVEEKNAKGKPTGKEKLDKSRRPDPFTYAHDVTAHVDVFVNHKARDSANQAIPDKQLISILSPRIIYNNKPWMRANKIAGPARESKLTGDKVDIDIINDNVQIEGIGGYIYPAYAIGMFYSPLYEYLDGLQLAQPVTMKASKSEFPIVKDYTRPMHSTIEIHTPESGIYHFVGIDIPVSKFSGFVNISDDYVDLKHFNSYTWQGVANLDLRIGISGKTSSLDGYIRAVNMDLASISKSFEAELSPALCYADFRFRSKSTKLNDLEGYGQLKLRDGKLLELGIFAPIAELITDLPDYTSRYRDKLKAGDPTVMQNMVNGVFSGVGIAVREAGDVLDETTGKVPGINYLFKYGLRDADADFTVKDGFMFTENLVAKGSNLTVPLYGSLNLDSLNVRARLWPDLGSILNVALSPITRISEHIIDIELYGKINDLKWRLDAESPFKRNRNKKQAQPATTP